MRKDRRMPRDPSALGEIGEALRVARAASGMSQRELARRTALNHKTISNIETGKTDPSYSVLVQISRTLGVRLSTVVSSAES